jgi:hypothetical protein
MNRQDAIDATAASRRVERQEESAKKRVWRGRAGLEVSESLSFVSFRGHGGLGLSLII